MKASAFQCGLGQWAAAGVALALWALYSPLAQAQGPLASPLRPDPSSACAVTPEYPLPAGAAARQALLSRLDAAAPRCLNDAGFHAWRGAVLLAQARPAAAIEALERALLIDPELPGAQLDFAQALLAVGDTASARGLLQQLSARSDLPAHLQPMLQRELAATDPSAWRSRWLLSSAFGVDSNLNQAPAASELTLTFPQGPITLPLDAGSRPQRGAAWLNAVQWQGVKPLGSQMWVVQAELRSRHTAQANTRYAQADLALSWLQAPEAASQWVLRGGLTRVDFGGQHLLEGLRASVLRQWRMPGLLPSALASVCRPAVGAEAEQRRYPVTPELNGRYGGFVLALSCQGPQTQDAGIFTDQLVSFQLRSGQEQPASVTRPGGRYAKTELRATWEGRRGPFKFNADYGYIRQADATGYSILLSDNLARSTARHSLRLELARSLPKSLLGGAEWFVNGELTRQSSNLTPFASRQNALYSGLRWELL